MVHRDGTSSEYNEVEVEAEPNETLMDVERELIKERKIPTPPPGQSFTWVVVTNSGEEAKVSPTTTIGRLFDYYQPQMLKVLFPAEWG